MFSLTDSNRMGLEERVLLPLWGSSKAQHCLRLGSKPNSEIHHQKVHCSLTRCQPSCQAILEFGWKYTLFSSRQAGMYLGVVTRSGVCGVSKYLIPLYLRDSRGHPVMTHPLSGVTHSYFRGLISAADGQRHYHVNRRVSTLVLTLLMSMTRRKVHSEAWTALS